MAEEKKDSSGHVNRGGSWLFIARYCRSANRGRFTPDFRFNDLGFRVVAKEGTDGRREER